LRRGALADALEAVRIYEDETAGDGQLAQDAAAIRVEALCQSRDADASAALTTFTTRWPRSAQRPRLFTVCAEVRK
jgi:uncharacterized protein (DUF2141 family)